MNVPVARSGAGARHPAAGLATGVLGTAWVRLSLRPLRRVTATAAAVAELPLAR